MTVIEKYAKNKVIIKWKIISSDGKEYRARIVEEEKVEIY